jgi:hypothetical protein
LLEKVGPVGAVQAKAFWGETDNSRIRNREANSKEKIFFMNSLLTAG